MLVDQRYLADTDRRDYILAVFMCVCVFDRQVVLYSYILGCNHCLIHYECDLK